MEPIEILDALGGPERRCLELAWESWCAGSIGIGAVVVDDRTDSIVCEGRNRVGESGAPPGSLAGTALAHAEINALVGLRLGPVDHLTLYTSLEPCCLCAGAIALMRVPRVRYLAPDRLFDNLWDHMSTHPELAVRRPEQIHLDRGPASELARLLPLSYLTFWNVTTLDGYSTADVALARTLLSDTSLLALATDGAPVVDALGALMEILE